jgi:hypothetical protein
MNLYYPVYKIVSPDFSVIAASRLQISQDVGLELAFSFQIVSE